MASRSYFDYFMITAVVAILLLLSGPAAFANDDGSDSGPLSKLQIHGFLTQAYAEGSFQSGRFPGPDGSPAGPTAEELSLGIPEDGTSAYRNMALQFRYEISDRDIMIVQLSSRNLGNSPITAGEDDIELDWAFYERRLADSTSVKVGRVQIPYGIFNEIRDVGTILPFYRPPFSVYREGSFTSETVDGISFSHTFAAESDWSLQSDFYYGEWELVEVDPFAESAAIARVPDGWGAQFWLNTPLYGLRFGLSYQSRDLTEGVAAVRAPGDKTEFDDFMLSVDAVFDRWIFRTEYREFDNAEQEVLPALGAPDFQATFTSYYAQLGFLVTPKFKIFIQPEVTDIEVNTSVFTETQDFTQREDFGIALNYAFSPSLVLKLEYHEVSGQDQGFLPVFGPAGFQLQPIYADLDGGDYTILSFSASF